MNRPIFFILPLLAIGGAFAEDCSVIKHKLVMESYAVCMFRACIENPDCSPCYQTLQKHGHAEGSLGKCLPDATIKSCEKRMIDAANGPW